MNGDSWTSPETRVLRLSGGFRLESGVTLPEVEVAYRLWGRPGEGERGAILVCHALTGSADADEWWGGLFGPGKVFDPAAGPIVCANVLGGCYGSTGPTRRRPGTDAPWGADFPRVTIRDMVHLQARLLDELGIDRLCLVIGGSMGGMQALEWAALYPQRVEALAPIAVSGQHSAWTIGISEAQRQAIRADARFRGGRYPPGESPTEGLAAARMMAMCSYRSWQSFGERFGRGKRSDGEFQVASYLRYQGAKLDARFDANTYLLLTEAMDSHDVGRGRGGLAAGLATIEAPALVVGVDSDGLYPPAEQEELARLLPQGELHILSSPHGHDGFLIEAEALNALLLEFLCPCSDKVAAVAR